MPKCPNPRHTSPVTRHPSPATRARGFSLLELEVAMLLFGIGLAGLCPLVVMHSRALESIERLLAPDVRYYLVPWPDPWTRKLGASASITKDAPGDPPPPPRLTVNDGDDGYSESGSDWVLQTDAQAFRGGYRQCWSPDPSQTTDSASSSLSDVRPGWYQVQVTWLEGPDRATDARYTVYDGADPLGTFVLNQQVPPSDAIAEERPWQILAAFYFGSGTAQVDLSGQGNGLVIADGVRLVPLRNTVEVLFLDRSLAGETVAVRVTVDAWGAPP